MINVLHEFFMTLNWKMMLWMYNRKLTECVTFWLVSEETGLSISDFSMVGAYKTTIFVPCKLKFRSHGDIWPYSWGKVPGKGGWLFFLINFSCMCVWSCIFLFHVIICLESLRAKFINFSFVIVYIWGKKDLWKMLCLYLGENFIF